MKKNKPQDKYSSYCKEHIFEFKYALTDEASRALTGWPARAAITLLAMSSVITFIDAKASLNPYANLTLLAYSPPILIVLLFPVIRYVFSPIERHSPIIMDLLCLTGILGFCITLGLIFDGASSVEELNRLYLNLQGQIAFVLGLGTTFAFHTNYAITFLRNFGYLLSTIFLLFMVNVDFLILNRLSVLEGFFLGTIASWVFHDSIRTRFYLKATDADARQHLYNQLSKLVYPHQLERIKLGEELESTMPLKEGKAIVNVFDVQKSSGIRHERTREFFMGVFKVFLQICMEGYEHNPLRSRAFRLKETGDGFISTVGYPFLPIDSRSLADSAVATGLEMFKAFNEEVAKFNYSRPIKAAMGLAYNSVQGTFQSGGIRSYDLFGDAIIQAAKYEELRKQPLFWTLICNHAESLGLKDFHIMMVQEVIYNSLSPNYRELFVEIDLWSSYFEGRNIQLLYDNDARYIYFHVLE